jgi:hypothetical protein
MTKPQAVANARINSHARLPFLRIWRTVRPEPQVSLTTPKFQK